MRRHGQEGQGHLYGAGRGGILGAAGVQLRGRAGSCLCLPFPADKEDFGRALGRTSVAMCAVTDIGFAQSLVKKLAAAEPEIYGAAAEALDLKAKRARERKEEQLQHEKNLRQGRHRVHGGKPPEPPPRVSGASGTGAQAPRAGTPASAAAGVSGGTPRPGL